MSRFVEYDCSCVRLGRDIAIYDMAGLGKANRRGLGAGLVSNTPSAANDCSHCHGFGSRLFFLEDFYRTHKKIGD
jgi:hypothetical protein